jgi:large subunit ribosomal protein L23
MVFLLYPMTTEKAAAAIERRNALTFAVTPEATKQGIKQEAEKNFGEKVARVTTMVTPLGRKKAIVRFARAGAAADVASKLKLV